MTVRFWKCVFSRVCVDFALLAAAAAQHQIRKDVVGHAFPPEIRTCPVCRRPVFFNVTLSSFGFSSFL